MIFHNFDPKYNFGAVFERVTPQIRSQRLPKPGAARRVHGFGTGFEATLAKNSSEIIFWFKVIQNHDFGALEMLFSGTVSNLMLRK